MFPNRRARSKLHNFVVLLQLDLLRVCFHDIQVQLAEEKNFTNSPTRVGPGSSNDTLAIKSTCRQPQILKVLLIPSSKDKVAYTTILRSDEWGSHMDPGLRQHGGAAHLAHWCQNGQSMVTCWCLWVLCTHHMADIESTPEFGQKPSLRI